MVDNITLALLSIKNYLEEYLDDTAGWERKYNMFIVGDPFLYRKEIVVAVNDSKREIGLPVILLDIGSSRRERNELGSDSGYEYITFVITIMAIEGVQLRVLSDLLRKKIDGLVFDVYNYTSGSRKPVVGSGLIEDVIATDISDWNNENVAARFNVVINSTIELDADNFI